MAHSLDWFLENCFLLVAVASASDFASYLLLEGLELRGELSEEGVVGVFLELHGEGVMRASSLMNETEEDAKMAED